MTATAEPRVPAPREDLYRHVNAAWLDTHEIPADQGAYGAFLELRDAAELAVRHLCEDAVREVGAGFDPAQARVDATAAAGAAALSSSLRFDRPSRWTLPITAFRVTPPSSLAIWLADCPSAHMRFSVSTRSSVQDMACLSCARPCPTPFVFVASIPLDPDLKPGIARFTCTSPQIQGAPMQPVPSRPGFRQMGVRRFGRVNWLGLYTLSRREIMRFMNVWQQTIFAPLMTSALFVVVFALALGRSRGEVMGLPYLAFLGPGILMMTVIQNAFANTSSSVISAKMQGNIVDTLMPPLSAAEILTGYLTGAVVRALIVAVAIGVGMALMLGQGIAHPLWALAFVLLGAVLMGGLGLLGGIIAQKFDQMAAITNFIVTPLSFLSGTFYSVAALPQPFRTLAHWNPIFYLIDGARYGIAGVSDAPPLRGLIVCALTAALVVWTAWRWLSSGYRMKP